MKRIIAVIFIISVVCFVAQSALGHHSAAMFDNQKVKELTGTIKEFQWKNPHVLIVIKMDDGTSYTAEWDSLRGLTNAGVAAPAQSALMPGARVVIIGNPMRDPAQIRASFPTLSEIKDTKVVDAIQIRPLCYVSLTIDHRVVDGHQTNLWLSRFIEVIESWPSDG